MTVSITSVRVVLRSLKRTFLKGPIRLVALAAFWTLLASFTGNGLVERMEKRGGSSSVLQHDGGHVRRARPRISPSTDFGRARRRRDLGPSYRRHDRKGSAIL